MVITWSLLTRDGLSFVVVSSPVYVYDGVQKSGQQREGPQRTRHRDGGGVGSYVDAVSLLSCQLLGMNCATPTDFTFSFQGFCQRGGVTDVHSDGWGMCFYEDHGIRQFHDTQAAAQSPVATMLGTLPIQTLNMMAHIRYATQGKVNLANVHPFSREMWGIHWSCCHNGDVPLFSNLSNNDNDSTTTTTTNSPLPWIGDQPEGERIYHPVGKTDSEALFCAILNALKAKFDTLPSLPVLHVTLQSLLEEIVQHDPENTILNLLLTCGPHILWVYSWPGSRPGSKVWNGLHYTVRDYPFRTCCTLQDLDYQVDFSRVTSKEDRVAVIATKPLTTDEEWIELERGELIVFDEGLPHKTPMDCVRVEEHGHGLESPVLEKESLEEDLRRYRLSNSFFLEGGGI